MEDSSFAGLDDPAVRSWIGQCREQSRSLLWSL